MSQGVHVLGGKCPGGKCPGGKCPEGICPWGKCPGGTCPGGLCPRIYALIKGSEYQTSFCSSLFTGTDGYEESTQAVEPLRGYTLGSIWSKLNKVTWPS